MAKGQYNSFVMRRRSSSRPPWPEVFVNDEERKQDFREAIATYDAVVAACHEAAYATVEVPKVSVAERVDFILGHINAGDGAASA